MSFDDRLRDELRRATEMHPLDEDDALRSVRSAPGASDDPVVVALDDGELPRRRSAGTRRLVGVVAAIALLAGAIAVPLALRDSSHKTARVVIKRHHSKASDGRVVLRAVVSALDATTNSGSFEVAYSLSATPGTPTSTSAPMCERSIARQGLLEKPGAQPLLVPSTSATPLPCFVPLAQTATSVHGTGIINVDPFAMVAASDVSNFGPVTVRVDDSTVWEYAGTDSLTPAIDPQLDPSENPGQPISGFAGLAEGTLGPREGAIAMMSLASPTGYLSITRDAVTSAAQIGTGSVDGVPVTIYRVNVDPGQLGGVPGLSIEERTAIKEALGLLYDQGFTGETTEISIDAAGFVRHTHAVNTFADGGTVTTDDTFSAFGCAGAVELPNRPVTPTTLAPACADTSPAAPTTTTPAGPPAAGPASTSPTTRGPTGTTGPPPSSTAGPLPSTTLPPPTTTDVPATSVPTSTSTP